MQLHCFGVEGKQRAGGQDGKGKKERSKRLWKSWLLFSVMMVLSGEQ